MANQWLRLWHDMPTDPKWRTVAKVSSQRIGDVMAVYLHLLVCASNATERGRTHSFNCEDVASALDIETEQVAAIVDAMQGRVLDGDMVAGWEKRQSAREDGSAERAKAWREAKKAAKNADRTQENADERKRTPDKDKSREEEIRETEPSGSVGASAPKPRATRKCPEGFIVTTELIAWAASEAPGASLDIETAKLRDHTFKNAISDWPGAWRNWMRRAHGDSLSRRTGGAPAGKTFAARADDEAKAKVHAWTGGLLGKDPNTIEMEAAHGAAKLLG